LAYLLDRHEQMATGWVGCIEEMDIGQELPGTLADFENGTINMGRHQHLSDPDLLTNHPPDLTDAFTLHLKQVVILSRVGGFHRRLRIQRQTEMMNGARSTGVLDDRVTPMLDKFVHRGGGAVDPSFCLSSGVGFGPPQSAADLIQDQPSFKALENAIVAFRLSIPKHLRDPFARPSSRPGTFANPGFRGVHGISVDATLYAMHVQSFVATLMLHAPVADMRAAADKSRDKILQATQSILESVHTLTATSYDLVLLPTHCTAYWTLTARTLMRFYRISLENGDVDDAQAILNEIDIMSLALGRIGEHLAVGFRGAKQIRDMVSEIQREVEEYKRREP